MGRRPKLALLVRLELDGILNVDAHCGITSRDGRSFEPYTQNIYVRRVLAGEFVNVNRHLVKTVDFHS